MAVTPDLTRTFPDARRDRSLVVLEGFHALKHALRFGADVTTVVASDDHDLTTLADRLAPDVAADLIGRAVTVPRASFDALMPHPPQTRVVGVAVRPTVDAGAVLNADDPGPVVLLEDPRTMANMGACVRVAAAVPTVAGVVTTGANDPWNPAAVRGAAGLHFALPVAHATDPWQTNRPIVAIDPDGDELGPGAIPARALVAFGTERYGISDELLARASVRLRIPMRPGVSSLNLATSVAAVLFGGLGTRST